MTYTHIYTQTHTYTHTYAHTFMYYHDNMLSEMDSIEMNKPNTIQYVSLHTQNAHTHTHTHV